VADNRVFYVMSDANSDTKYVHASRLLAQELVLTGKLGSRWQNTGIEAFRGGVRLLGSDQSEPLRYVYSVGPPSTQPRGSSPTSSMVCGAVCGASCCPWVERVRVSVVCVVFVARASLRVLYVRVSEVRAPVRGVPHFRRAGMLLLCRAMTCLVVTFVLLVSARQVRVQEIARDMNRAGGPAPGALTGFLPAAQETAKMVPPPPPRGLPQIAPRRVLCTSDPGCAQLCWQLGGASSGTRSRSSPPASSTNGTR
jgi:hypothetical protein